MSEDRARERTLVFLHGAGGFDEDRPLADAISASAGARLVLPRLPDEDMSFDGWAEPIRRAIAPLGADDLLVGHSFGGSILVKVLAERVWPVERAVLLAIPNWGPEGWNVDHYAFAGTPPPQSLVLHHCSDDDVVPVEHLALNAAALPGAATRTHPTGGHQFAGLEASVLA